MNQITHELKAKIFGLYAGAMVNYNTDWRDEKGPVTKPLCGTIVDGDGSQFFTIKDAGLRDLVYFRDQPTAQLILKPLSEISDEDNIADAEKVVELMNSLDYGPLDPVDVAEWLYDVMGGNSALQSDYVSGRQFAALFNLLAELGYALPYKGQDLHDIGIAVKK